MQHRTVVARGQTWRWGRRGVSVATEFQFYNMKGVLGDLVHNNMNVLEAVELCT